MHVLYIMSLPRSECCADNEDDWDHLQKYKSNVANYQRLELKAKNADTSIKKNYALKVFSIGTVI